MVRPAGTPSRMAMSALPCDSPAVRNRSIRSSFYPNFLQRPAARARVFRPIGAGGVLAPRSLIMTLIADRFVRIDQARAIDLASGEPVVLRIGSAGGPSEQARWLDRCGWLYPLRHVSIATLVDYGAIGESSRFEAWRADAPWRGSAIAAGAVVEAADRFLAACGLTAGCTYADVHACGGRPVVVPAPSGGYGLSDATESPALGLADCGLRLVPRETVATIAEAFEC